MASTAGVLLLVGAAAAAATQVPGATYAGSLSGAQSKIAISLRVSADGRRVESLQLSRLPIYCAGGEPPPAAIVFKPATISRSGHFVANGKDTIAVGPLKGGSVIGTVMLTGAFAPGRRESGVIRTRYRGSASKCSGQSSYRTQVRGR